MLLPTRRVSRVGVVWLVAAVSLVSAGPASGASGDIRTFAGTGVSEFSGDGGAAIEAGLSHPWSAAFDGDGNLFVVDQMNRRLRKIDVSGNIITIAGDGTDGFSGDGGPASLAQLAQPAGVAVDDDGNIYIADQHNHRIRMIDTSGDISTVVGNGVGGGDGDGGPATEAQLFYPNGVAVDGAGNIYIADWGNNRIRKVVAATGDIETIAGTGTTGFGGDGGAATEAELNRPRAVALDGNGNIYIADTQNWRIRMIDPSGEITTIAGTGEAGFSGDGGPAISAQLWGVMGLAVDSDGNLYIADTYNHRIRMVDTSGDISTVAGTDLGFSGDGGAATSAQLQQPNGLTVDGFGNLFIVDGGNHRIRFVEAADADGDGYSDLVDNFPGTFSRCRTSQATIIGTPVGDVLNGTAGPDVIMGFDGPDTINGLDGADLICAGNGADVVTGGDGKDRIYAENGADTIFGNEMSDRIYGGDGNDTLRGNGGTRDRLFGGEGVDDLNGGTGTDDRCTLGETYAACEVYF